MEKELDLEKQIELFELVQESINGLEKGKEELEEVLKNIYTLIEEDKLGVKYSNLKNVLEEVRQSYEEKNNEINELKNKLEFLNSVDTKLKKIRERQSDIQQNDYNLQRELEFTKKIQGFSFKIFGVSVLVFISVIFYNNWFENSFKNKTNAYVSDIYTIQETQENKILNNEKNIKKIIDYINTQNKK